LLLSVISCLQGAQQQSRHMLLQQSIDWTDRRTPDRKPCASYYASSVSKITMKYSLVLVMCLIDTEEKLVIFCCITVYRVGSAVDCVCKLVEFAEYFCTNKNLIVISLIQSTSYRRSKGEQ